MHLHPSVLPQLCTILAWNSDFNEFPSSSDAAAPSCHIATIAAWADKIRFRKRWSAGLHYVGAVGDHPSSTCLFPGTSGWAGRDHINVLGGIRNTTEILSGWRYSVKNGARPNIEVMDEALRFLVHFMGDVHMPLHLTGRDRGGNGDKVLFDGRQTSACRFPSFSSYTWYTHDAPRIRPPFVVGRPPHRQIPPHHTQELHRPPPPPRRRAPSPRSDLRPLHPANHPRRYSWPMGRRDRLVVRLSCYFHLQQRQLR